MSLHSRISASHGNIIAGLPTPSFWEAPSIMVGLRKCSSILTLVSAWTPSIGTTFASQVSNFTALDLASPSIYNASVEDDDPRFSMRIIYGETALPATAVFMNAVELLSYYAEMDFLGRTYQRHGIVLPGFPQVEIAVIPAPPATSIEVRLVIWAIYGTIIDMAYQNVFKECEAPFRWDETVVGHIYFTIPMDTVQQSRNYTGYLQLSKPANGTIDPESTNSTFDLETLRVGGFSWTPVYKPDGKILSPKEVFVLTMGTLKRVAEYQITEKVTGAFYIGAEFVDAHVEVYLHGRSKPRSKPPFFEYGHIIEAARRIPGWMLGHRQFAEFWGYIRGYNRPLGLIVYAKGRFRPGLEVVNSNVTASG